MHQVNIYEVNIYDGDDWVDVKEFKTEAKARAFIEKFNKNFKGHGDELARYAPDEDNQ